MRGRSAQSILEYTILLGLVTMAFLTMRVYVRRGIAAAIKISADEIGAQDDGLAEVDPRNGSVEETHFATKTMDLGDPSQPGGSLVYRNIGAGGAQTTGRQEIKFTDGTTDYNKKNSGWYYIKVNGQWELRRKSD